MPCVCYLFYIIIAKKKLSKRIPLVLSVSKTLALFPVFPSTPYRTVSPVVELVFGPRTLDLIVSCCSHAGFCFCTFSVCPPLHIHIYRWILSHYTRTTLPRNLNPNRRWCGFGISGAKTQNTARRKKYLHASVCCGFMVE